MQRDDSKSFKKHNILMKTVFILLTALFVSCHCDGQSSGNTNVPTYFVQCLFEIELQEDVDQLQDALRLSPFLEMVRLDWHSQRALLFTNGIENISFDDVRSWFMQYSETVRCINIGVKNIDVMEKFPFTNCEN